MRSIFVVLALLTTTGAGWADVVGTWKTGDKQSLKISYRDDNNVRMDAGSEGYMLVSGNKVYMVSRAEGKWQAMDMDEMSGMMKMFGKSPSGASAIPTEKPRFESTGQEETIAGYKGEVYRVTYAGSSGSSYQEEVVLSDHPDVKKLNQAWIVLASRMAQMMGRDTAEELEQATKAAQEQGYGGMLRSGDDMILQSLEKPSLKASHYKLPQGVEIVHMPNMGGGVPQEADVGTSHGASGPSGTREEGNEEDVVSETAREMGDTAKEEAKDSAKRGMKKALEGLW